MHSTFFIKTPEKSKSAITVNFFHPLGAGNYGSVYLGKVKATNELLAIKLVEVSDAYDKEKCQAEIAIMETLLPAPNIIGIYGHTHDHCSYTIAMEYMPNGSLHDRLIVSKHPPLHLHQQVKIMLGIAHGLAYMHRLNILHCDLKPANILLTDKLEAKICDFGLSKRIYVDNLDEVTGSPIYAAPEIILAFYGLGKTIQAKENDIYSFSIICWAIVAQAIEPYTHITSEHQLINWVVFQGKRETIPSEPKCPKIIAGLIEKGWSGNPKVRPSADEMVKMLELYSATILPAVAVEQNTNISISDTGKKSENSSVSNNSHVSASPSVSSSSHVSVKPNSNDISKDDQTQLTAALHAIENKFLLIANKALIPMANVFSFFKNNEEFTDAEIDQITQLKNDYLTQLKLLIHSNPMKKIELLTHVKASKLVSFNTTRYSIFVVEQTNTYVHAFNILYPENARTCAAACRAKGR